MRNVVRVAVAGCLMAALVTGAAAEEKKKAEAAKKPLTDADFVMKAASSDMTEIMMSTMAKEMAKSADVKMFSERMITDHTKSSEELKAAVADSGLALPTAPLAAHQKHMAMLKKGEGDFDQTYMKVQLMHHKEALDLLTRGSKELQNEKLKAFSTKMVPVVKEHLDMAKKISGGSSDKGGGDKDKSDK